MPTATIRPRGGNALQQIAVSGRTPRSTQAETARALSPIAFERRANALENRRLSLAEDVQARQQRQETIANAISGVGTIGQTYSLAKDVGLIGGGAEVAAPAGGALSPTAIPATTPALVGGAAPAVAGGIEAAPTLTPAATGPAASSGLTSSASGAAAASGAGTTAPAGSTATAGLAGEAGALGAVGGGLGGAAIGAQLGSLVRTRAPRGLQTAAALGTIGPAALALGEKGRARVAGISAGATAGAAIGFATGGPVGAAIGFVGGGAGGGVCIVVTTCYGPESEQVAVCRAYRDAKMTVQQLRAYYFLSEALVPKMEADPRYKEIIRTKLVDPLVKYGRFVMGMPLEAPPPSPEETIVAQQFLNFLSVLGADMDVFIRSNGETI